jgi:hypothetical protein
MIIFDEKVVTFFDKKSNEPKKTSTIFEETNPLFKSLNPRVGVNGAV